MVFVAMLLCALGAIVSVAEARTETAPAGRHSVLACSECHPEGPETHAECLECHDPEENLHPDGVSPTGSIPSVYPLVKDRISCPTCHRLHQPTGPHALRGFAEGLTKDLKGFCASCHGERLTDTNPHGADAGTNRCAFCHASIDVERVLFGQTLKARVDVERLCDFCHDVRSKNHPRNIDPAFELPGSLPRGAGGEITCITCHNPHGSSRVTHYIREGYALYFERGREDNPHADDRFACGACHMAESPEDIATISPDLRFRGDTVVLCISCHIMARGHHPVGMPLPEAMTRRLEESGGLPLDAAGRTTCTTCHTNNCETGEQRMSVRRYDSKRLVLDLCWVCHPKEEFAKKDPHRKRVDDTTEGCVFCHDHPPVKGLERPEELYFVSQVKMICLRCHEDLSDQDVSHMGKVPSPQVLENLQRFAAERHTQFPLDGDGRFTCTTCHNAHFSAKTSKHKTRLPSREMCPLCHAQ